MIFLSFSLEPHKLLYLFIKLIISDTQTKKNLENISSLSGSQFLHLRITKSYLTLSLVAFLCLLLIIFIYLFPYCFISRHL